MQIEYTYGVTLPSRLTFQNLERTMWLAQLGKGMLFSVDQAFEIARIYKALKRFADLQGPICYNDAQNKEMSLIVY